MSSRPVALPHWIQTVCGWCALTSTVIIFFSILLHLLNYRKPFQQRLMIRIQLIVPLFAILCYSMLRDPTSVFNKFVIEPIREIYEAFVIYTFFSLLTDMLGGAKSIIIMSSGRPPVAHPGFLKWVLPPLDISDPQTFLAIKRGILQYVWLKPIICFGVLFLELLGWYDVNDMSVGSLYLWFTIVYNFSVSLSLYCLAIFWKILWVDLKPFNPMGKFLCVKLIIFASYWQGVILAILNIMGVLPGNSSQDENGAPNIGVSIQNALLCVELIAFAWGHWFSFSYRPFTISRMPTGRLQFYYALRDMFGIKDLVIDFALTFYGDYYKDYKQFDSVEALIAHPSLKSRMGRINQGLRYQPDGKQKHWLPLQNLQASPLAGQASIRSTSEINAISNHIYQQQLGRSQSIYAPSLVSTGTSTRALYPHSPKVSPPSSPLLSDAHSVKTNPSYLEDEFAEPLSETLKKLNPDIMYDNEYIDEDEQYYQAACSVVNNYNLDQTEVKKLINYPIVDELIVGHEYGYKVKKLRADRIRQQRQNNGDAVSRNEYRGYGSV